MCLVIKVGARGGDVAAGEAGRERRRAHAGWTRRCGGAEGRGGARSVRGVGEWRPGAGRVRGGRPRGGEGSALSGWEAWARLTERAGSPSLDRLPLRGLRRRQKFGADVRSHQERRRQRSSVKCSSVQCWQPGTDLFIFT